MRRALCLAAAAATAGVLVLPAGAAGTAQVTDPAGDANAVNGQGLLTGGLADGSTTPQQYAPADLLSVTYSTTYTTEQVGDDGLKHTPTGLEARIVTSQPAKSDGPTLIYRLNVDVGGCGGFIQYFLPGPASAPTDPKGLQFRQFASRGCPADATKTIAGWTVAQDGATLVISMPYAGTPATELPYIAPGRFLSTLAAEVRTNLGVLTAPAIDITGAGLDFKIGSDVPKNVPCTTGCPEA